MEKLRGVNLGGWLVLEKWMTPSVFASTKAIDEYTLMQAWGKQAEAKLRKHRDNFITEADFAWIKARGLNAVRLPVGYWIFGDSAPFVAGIEYVDKAFSWAETHGLAIILDLHAVPGSQNGHDHSGRVGKILWKKGDNRALALRALEQLAERYKTSPALRGIELVNEPSWRLGRRFLHGYYEAGASAVRTYCGTQVPIIVSDAYRPKRWKRFMRQRKNDNFMLDIHLYQLFSRLDKRLSADGHIAKVLHEWLDLVRGYQKHFPVMIGEWSLGLDTVMLARLSQSEQRQLLRAYGAAQLFVFDQAQAWFYWSYKTEDAGAWSFRSQVENGNLPDQYS